MTRCFSRTALLGALALTAACSDDGPKSAVDNFLGDGGAFTTTTGGGTAGTTSGLSTGTGVNTTGFDLDGGFTTGTTGTTGTNTSAGTTTGTSTTGTSTTGTSTTGTSGGTTTGTTGGTTTGTTGMDAGLNGLLGGGSTDPFGDLLGGSTTGGTTGGTASGPGQCAGDTPHGCYGLTADSPDGCPAQVPEIPTLLPGLDQWDLCSGGAVPPGATCSYEGPSGGTGSCICDAGAHWICIYL